MKYEYVINYLINNYKNKQEYTFNELNDFFVLDINDLYYKMKNYVNPDYIIEINFISKKVFINKHVKLNLNNKIVDIRGSMWDCKITFENGYILKCSGELDKDGFTIYTDSLKISAYEKEILKKLLEESIKKTPNSFITIK